MTTRKNAGARATKRRARAVSTKAARREARKLGILGPTTPEIRPTAPSLAPAATLPGEDKPQGSDAVAAWGGVLVQGEGGDRDAALVGENFWRTMSNVLGSTTIVAAGVRSSLNLIAGVEWDVQANPDAKDKALAQKCADLVRVALLGADMPLPWSVIVKKAAMYRFYGYALFNWIMRTRSDGTRVFSDIQHRPQSTIRLWDIPSEGAPFVGVVQQTKNGGQYYLARERLWYLVDPALSDQPTGVGLLRHIVEHARRLARAEQIEAYGYDANLRGVPVGRAPLGELANAARVMPEWKNRVDAYLDAQTQELQKFLADHIKTADQGFMLDSSVYTSAPNAGSVPSAIPKWAVDLLQGDDMGLAAAASWIERINREIARVLCVEYMIMGEGSSGSHAMHADKTSQQGAMLNSTTAEIAHFARNDLARVLVARNYGPQAAEDATPFLVPSPISTEDLRTQTGAVLDMSQSGAYIPPDDPIFDVIRKRARLPLSVKPPVDIMGALRRTSVGLPPTDAPPPVPGATPPPGDVPPRGGSPAPSDGGSKAPTDELRAGGAGSQAKAAA